MEENKTGLRQIQERVIRIKLADGTLVNGQVNINKKYGYDRLSDLVSSNREPFLILFKVILYDRDTGNPEKYKTLFVNKNHIIWAAPEDDQK